MSPNLEKLIKDLIDIGLAARDLANGKFLSAIRRGVALAGELDGKRNWKACGEEFLALSHKDKEPIMKVVKEKLAALEDKKLEEKIAKGFELAVELSDQVEDSVGVGKKIADFIKEA